MLRPRLTVRRLMIAVAISAVAFAVVGLRIRYVRFRDLAEYHRLESQKHVVWPKELWPESVHFPLPTPRSEHHDRLSEKYKRAAARPWIPVPTDPPEPE